MPESLPIIDLASRSGDGEPWSDETLQQVREACESTGFFLITGHGVGDDLIEAIYRRSRDFFDLPEAEKAQVKEIGSVMGGLSHCPFKVERLAATLGEETPGDLKETLDYGPGFPGDTWPRNMPALREAWLAYFASMDQLVGRLRRLFAVALDLSPDFFEPTFDRHLSSLRVLNYPHPSSPPEAGQLRAGAHTDYGFLTVLRSEDAPGGLQLLHRSGEWIDVPALPGAFVVNIGDALMRWTNDHWVSTLHRVVNPPPDARGSTRRQSIAFFHNPNAEAVIECLPGFAGGGRPAKYPSVRYADYAEERFRQAHGAEKTLALDSARA